MKKLSRVLTGIMLCLFALLMLCAVLMGAFYSRSYTAAFALAAVCVAVICLLSKRLRWPDRVLKRLGPVKTGVILSVLCLVLNLAVILIYRIEPLVDYLTFWRSAVSLGTGEGINGAHYLALFPHIVGYSAFLGGFIKIFGQSAMLAPLVNLGLTVISGVLIYLLCLRWRGLKTAAAAGLLWALCPSKALFNAQVLSEPLYTCLILLFLLVVTELHRRLRGQRRELWVFALCALLCGLLLTAVNAARPIAAVPLIAFFIWVLVLRSDELSDRRRWAAWALFALLMCASYSVTLHLWQGHVEKLLGEEPAFSYGHNVCVGLNTDEEGSYGSYSVADMERFQGYYFGEGMTAPQAQAKMLEVAKERFASGNIDFFKLYTNKLRTLLGNDEAGVYYLSSVLSGLEYSALAVLSNVFYYLVVAFALLGAYRLWREMHSSPALIPPLFVLGLSLAHMLVDVSGRYHYAIIPMLIMLAAFAVGESPRGGEFENTQKDNQTERS